MISVTRRYAGFSLLELMITLAIALAAFLAAAPFAQGWIDQSRVNQTMGQLRQGYATARALALMNPPDAAGMAAAVICKSGTTIFVHPGTPGNCGATATLATSPVWSFAIPGGNTMQILDSQSAPFFCMGLSSLGVPMAGMTLGGKNCTASLTFELVSREKHSGQIQFI